MQYDRFPAQSRSLEELAAAHCTLKLSYGFTSVKSPGTQHSLQSRMNLLILVIVLTLWGYFEIALTLPHPVASSSAALLPASFQQSQWRCPFKEKPISCAARDRALHELRTNSIVLCLWDGNSAMHPEQLSQMNKPSHFKWSRQCVPQRVGNLFALVSLTHLDHARECCSNDTYTVFLTTEPPAILPQMYDTLRTHISEFDAVLSLAGPDLIQGDNVVYWPWGSSWVPLDEWAVHPKKKLCSIIASNADRAPGHKLRHEVVRMLRNMSFPCDVLGHGYAPVRFKKDGLADYMFSIVIENSVSGTYMTEKLIDSLACGTIPLYWGNSEALRHFPEGVLAWESLSDLRSLLSRLSAELYASLRHAAETNLKLAQAFAPPERWLWDNVFSCAYKRLEESENCVL